MSKNFHSSMISNEDCIEILSKKLAHKNFSLIDKELVNVSADGFLGEYYTLLIKYKLNEVEIGKEQFFVKTLPFGNAIKAQMVIDKGLFKKEATFYGEICGSLAKYSESRKWAPGFYKSRDELIVLEDLNYSDSHIMPFGSTFEHNHMELTLKAAAKMHASSIIFETKENFSIEKNWAPLLKETLVYPENPFFVCGLKSLKSIALERTKFGRGSQHENFVEAKFLEIGSKIYGHQEFSDGKVPKAIVHKDIWRTNCMFKFNRTGSGEIDYKSPTSCLFVDFQHSRFLPITVDVALAIHYNLTNESRSQNESKYLQIYYDELKDQLRKDSVEIEGILKFSDFLEDMKRIKLYALALAGTYFTLTDVPPHVFKELNDTDPLEYNRITVEDRGEFIIKQMDKFENLNEKMTGIVEELVQHMIDCYSN